MCYAVANAGYLSVCKSIAVFKIIIDPMAGKQTVQISMHMYSLYTPVLIIDFYYFIFIFS